MEETQEQRQWTSLGSSSVLLGAECGAEKLDRQLFLGK